MIGERYEIRSMDRNGAIKRRWFCQLLESNQSEYIFEGQFEFDVQHAELGFIAKGTISREYFWTDRWYNIFVFYHPDGRTLRNYYCNISMPPVIADSAVEYIDLELDIIVWPDLTRQFSDELEFDSIRDQMRPDDIQMVDAALQELLRLIDSRSFPFNVG